MHAPMLASATNLFGSVITIDVDNRSLPASLAFHFDHSPAIVIGWPRVHPATRHVGSRVVRHDFLTFGTTT
jgi:hypothetical protein